LAIMPQPMMAKPSIETTPFSGGSQSRAVAAHVPKPSAFKSSVARHMYCKPLKTVAASMA
jgi:hypothetical protein